MVKYLFTSTTEGWIGDLSHNGGAGSPGLGCLSGTPSGGGATAGISGLSKAVTSGNPFSCRVRFVGDGTSWPVPQYAAVQIEMYISSVVFFPYGDTVFEFVTTSDDSGWLLISGTMPVSGTLQSISITLNSVTESTVYLDSVAVNENLLGPRRLLGISSDSGHLYVTGIEDGILTLNTYTRSPLAVSGTATFGSAAYTDPDTFTKGLYPVPSTYLDGCVWLRGRDGSNRQVLYNDTNGTLGWVDVGAGTATWGTAKYCVALMPSPVRPIEVAAAFSDNDIYYSVQYGTAGWLKSGDAPTNLRAAGRHPVAGEEFLLAGTAAGTLHYTHNLGQSFDVAGGTALGTINHIEFSW